MAAGHLDVRKQKLNVRPRLQQRESIVGIHGFKRRKAGTLHDIYGAHPQQHLIFDNKDRRFGRGELDRHRAGLSCEENNHRSLGRCFNKAQATVLALVAVLVGEPHQHSRSRAILGRAACRTSWRIA